MTVQHIIDFWLFDLGASPLGQSSPKGKMTCYPPRSTILQNFSPIAQTFYKICVGNIFTLFDHSTSFKVKSDGASRKPMGPMHNCSRLPTSYLSLFSKYFQSNFWRWPFDLGRANPWAKVHQKGRRPASHLGLPSYQLSSLYVNPRQRYPLQKSCGQTHHIVNDINPACLSACEDNK